MTPEELLLYECPTIGEFIPAGWISRLISKYLAWKINRKWKRYQRRLELKRKYGNNVE